MTKSSTARTRAKRIIILGDGMADEPISSLGNKTPLQVANKPNIDMIAKLGRSGLLSTVPKGYHPGSEIAILSLLGYDLDKVFEGRGSLEAASMGVAIEPGEMVMRCNLINITDGKIISHAAGHISNEEAKELIDYLQEKLGNESIRFFNGVSYRHLLKIKGGNKHINTTPPHDVLGSDFTPLLSKSVVPDAQPTADLINDLIMKSQELLPMHRVNEMRVAAGKLPANSIWPWSPGYKPAMETFMQKYGITSGSAISAVDLIKGIGVYAGLDPIYVEGATGLYNTNYEGKTAAAIDALKKQDFVFLHIEASDEAGHEGDVELKVKTIEYLDSRVVGPILKEVSTWSEPVTIAVLPDHPTPCYLRTHTNNPVPFAIYCKDAEPDVVDKFDEFAARNGSFGLLHGDEFMNMLMAK